MKKAVLIVAALALIAGGIWYGNQPGQESGALTLSGNVDIRSVSPAFRVSGRLQSLAVDEGDTVQAGMELGRLDEEPYCIALQQAEAAVEQARTAVGTAEKNAAALHAALQLRLKGYREEEIAEARAQLAAQQVLLDNAQKEYSRYLGLIGSRSVSQQDLDAAERTLRSQQATVQAYQAKLALLEAGCRPEEIDQARAQYGAAVAAVEEARAQLSTAEAACRQARLNWEDTRLLAPAEAIVMTRSVEPGTMLAAGDPVLTLSLRHPVWVRAYVDECHLNRIHPGQEVTVTDDSGNRCPGVIGFISPQAEFTPKTVETADIRTTLVYRLRIIVKEPCPTLNQGAPVSVTIRKGTKP